MGNFTLRAFLDREWPFGGLEPIHTGLYASVISPNLMKFTVRMLKSCYQVELVHCAIFMQKRNKKERGECRPRSPRPLQCS